MTKDPLCRHHVFGFGSIINTATHAPWLAAKSSKDDNDSNDNTSNGRLPGQRATLMASFGFFRGWNYRSATGFTALGISRCTSTKATSTSSDNDHADNEQEEQELASDINGVLFRITTQQLAAFDLREVGYDRVQIPFDQLYFPPLSSTTTASTAEIQQQGIQVDLQIKPDHDKLWVYVPQKEFLAQADEDHPILQSYVDTVLQGCLEWGGQEMCQEFVATTSRWSPYFLNDTPSSRRPWLFRKAYTTIDRILSQNPKTHFADRRHPEEFASAFLIKMMRGSWSIPRRNPVFTGREMEMGQIHAKLTGQQRDGGGVAKLEVAGMGGVGKSQICIEYCYRSFPSYFGLIIWLNAQSAESVAAGYRQLMADTTGMDVNDKDTDEVVTEVKARLFRSAVPWLLVFDNLDDPTLLEKFVPAGGTCGHVLVTTRLVNTSTIETSGAQTTMVLGCFQPAESMELLCRAAGKANICADKHKAAAGQLADQLGHLPLALGMAAAYMSRCDVDCSEYLTRYVKSEQTGALLGHEAVSSSLSLSLNAIKNENMAAWEALRLLAWLGADQITKKLLRSLLLAKNDHEQKEKEQAAKQIREAERTSNILLTVPPLLAGAALLPFLAGHFLLMDKRSSRRTAFSAVIIASVSLTAAVTWYAKQHETNSSKESKSESKAKATIQRRTSFSALFELTDEIWNILKSYSLLVVKEGQGSIHRLLSQSMRVSQSEVEERRNRGICLRALLRSWTFKPEQVDTWNESTNLLEHVKSIVLHSIERGDALVVLDTAILSRQAGVFSAMVLNRFTEAQVSFEHSLAILIGAEQCNPETEKAKAAAYHELGRVFRYQAQFRHSEESLREALTIREKLLQSDPTMRNSVAATLHELGVLEVKKHNLESAATFLEKALDLRRTSDTQANCASTLHQLAAIMVARKPPSLDEAEYLLDEALGLSMQIGQRAATLKQLARVAIRRGEFDTADKSLSQALELYVELYGENTLHINVAAVKFQQGALAFQRDDLELAWAHFSECLRARRHVYAYTQGNHLEVSSVLHELGCVAIAQKRTEKACEMLSSEKEILDRLCETASQQQRLWQARLTNLTWLLKCSKALGNEEKIRRFTAERSELKRKSREKAAETPKRDNPHTASLQREALNCRFVSRQFALASSKDEVRLRQQLDKALGKLSKELSRSNDDACSIFLRRAVAHFHQVVSESLAYSQKRAIIFEACDDLRNILRECGLQVQDTVHRGKS